MIILSRPKGDTFSMRLFVNLVQKLKPPFSAIYLWSASIDPYIIIEDQSRKMNEHGYRRELMGAIKEEVVVIGIKDHLTSVHFNPWTEDKPNIVVYLEDMFKFYSDKKFILLSSLENLDYYIQLDNVRIVPWGGCITNHQLNYQNLNPVLDKNLDSEYSFVSLNRNARNNRCALVSLLHGLDLDQHGLISCMFKNNFENFTDHTDWNFSNDQAHIKDLAVEGFKKLKNAELKIKDDVDIYKDRWNDNVYNFQTKLVNYYKDVFVEFVSETSYTERCFNLTEKTLNSIYACNFPILISSVGTVKFLKEMGMDTFDDIVDHSYDQIENPVDRVYRAIVDNRELLTNLPRTKDLWVNNQSRFLKNIEFAKNKIYTFYANRADDLFQRAKNEFNLPK